MEPEGWENMSVTSYKKSPAEVEVVKGLSKRILNRQVVHHIFEDAALFTNDEFWKHKLICAARNKFPRNYYFRDGFLINRKKSKTKMVKIPVDDPGEALRVFIGFMNDRGIISDMDAQTHRSIGDFQIDMQENIPPESWSKVPPKMRSNYITEYVISNTKGLSQEAVKSLYVAINIGIKTKIFDNSNITMGKFCIVHIEGLIYKAEEDRFCISPQVWASNYEACKQSRVTYPDHTSLDEPLGVFAKYPPDFRTSWTKSLDVYSKLSIGTIGKSTKTQPCNVKDEQPVSLYNQIIDSGAIVNATCSANRVFVRT